MKKKIIIISIITALTVLLIVVGRATYSLYKSTTEITINSTSDNMVCNAVIEEDSNASIYGYKKLKVTVSNYETVNNVEKVTDVPLRYSFTLSGPTGTKFREYDDTTQGRTIQNGQGFTNTNSIVVPGSNGYEEFTTTKSSKEYYFEVMTTSDGTAAQTKDYSVELKCAQAQPATFPVYATGAEVYFDPTKSDQSECNDTDHTGATCYKWYVIETNDSTSDSTITLQLDHNIVNLVAWALSGDNSSGAVDANAALATATNGWNNVQTIKNELNADVKARMITYDEIKSIPGVTDKGTYLTTLPSWLTQNIGGSTGNYGYWTSTPVPDEFYGGAFYAFHVSENVIGGVVLIDEDWGARPVITILKSKISNN